MMRTSTESDARDSTFSPAMDSSLPLPDYLLREHSGHEIENESERRGHVHDMYSFHAHRVAVVDAAGDELEKEFSDSHRFERA